MTKITWCRSTPREGKRGDGAWRKPQDYDSWVEYHEERYPIGKPVLQMTANLGYSHLKKRR